PLDGSYLRHHHLWDQTPGVSPNFRRRFFARSPHHATTETPRTFSPRWDCVAASAALPFLAVTRAPQALEFSCGGRLLPGYVVSAPHIITTSTTAHSEGGGLLLSNVRRSGTSSAGGESSARWRAAPPFSCSPP